MTRSFWDAVNKVIEQSDVIIEVLDARFIDETRNREVEEKVKAAGKKVVIAINKSDLIGRESMDWKKGVYISSTRDWGLGELRRAISSALGEQNKEKVIIGVVGYPNVGKSSVINALTERESALTSPQSGFTKGMQLIKMKKGVYMLDTPGVIPYLEKDRTKHALTSTTDFSKIRNPEMAALELIERFPKEIKKHYGVEGKDEEEILEAIARRLGKLKKGGLTDTISAARTILMDWQRGRIRIL